MTGPEHYARAEQLLREVRDGHQEGSDVAAILAAAQVHATLAVAAATAMSGRGGGMHSADFNAWDNAAGVPVSDGGDD
ncbi:hypothetical protein ABZ890_39535 [Streptomyces sp. NPDC046984]|uniref:hypothetical protein n=1 Tax=Streptomyces sp. NPDC046984 TaxID=3155138 RepID=UPI0033F22A7E